MMRWRELKHEAGEVEALGRFYHGLYTAEFPLPDERESLENMIEYLRLKAEGWYERNGKSNYHILLGERDGEVVAGSISDYLGQPNAGVIEFLVVAPSQRNRGLGRKTLEATEALLRKDAMAAGRRDVELIVGEMDDPYRMDDWREDQDPFARALVWNAWGYGRLDFEYVQPALSEAQKAVTHLLLMGKASDKRREVEAARVRAVVHEYLRLAMRIDEPERHPDFRTMAADLESRGTVRIESLAAYVGRDPERPIKVREIVDPSDPDLDGIEAVYRASFTDEATAIDPSVFRESQNLGRHRGQRYAHHLWALRADKSGPVEGMVSFFTFPGAGYGGYLALTGSMRGTGRLRPLVALIEERMVRDRLGARGWYAELDRHAPEERFRRVGFVPVDVDYRQPSLSDEGDELAGPRLRLMYKPFGSRSSAAAGVGREELASAMEWVGRVVYGLDDAGVARFVRGMR